MKTQKVKVSQVKSNPNNPRIIKDDKFKKLVKSILEFPKMLEIRPIVVNSEMVVLGGNMRLKACIEAGLKEVFIVKADDLTEEEQKQFIIKDNVGFGEWDWDILANEWEADLLEDWGMNVPNFDSESYNPVLDPLTNYDDVTKEQIQKEAERLANQMLKDRKKVEVICPDCGTEFQIDA
jgi:ParB-like chromosome segregation protein Spo0J